MKKTLTFLLALALLLSCCPMFSLQTRAAVEGPYEYTVFNGEASITGCDRSVSGDITIPATLGGYPVAAIKEFAFDYCDALTSVTIPEGVQFIKENAFSRCAQLRTITVPKTVEGIGTGAFRHCPQLTGVWVHADNPNYLSDAQGSLLNKQKTTLYRVPCALSGSYTIPQGVQTVDCFALELCEMITHVTIPESVKAIMDYAFDSCSSLTEINIPKSVTLIDHGAFRYCKSLTGIWVDSDNPNYVSGARGVLFTKDKTVLLHAPGALSDSYSIPASVTTIGYGAFNGCEKLKEVTLPDSITAIKPFAFSGCLQLTCVNIPDRITAIGDYAFDNCRMLTAILLPASLESIGTNVFFGCTNLTGIWVDEENSHFSSDDSGVLFNKNKTQLLRFPGGASGSYAVPDSVTVIGDYAFFWCPNLRSVTIGEGVTTIGEACFNNCSNLECVSIPSTVTAIGEAAFYDCNVRDVYYAGTEEQWAQIEIAAFNEPLTNVHIHFEATTPEEPEIPETPSAPGAPGNLDGNSYLNEDDAIYLLQYVLMPDMFPVTQNVDFDGSGTVNEDDAIYLLQHLLMPDMFPL